MEQRCRICGCMEYRACVTNGVPCHWVETDLCSACRDKLAVLDVLNSLEVEEQHGGDEPYILVIDTSYNREKLYKVGITDDQIDMFADNDTFCILALAADQDLADDYVEGKFILWGPIDDELRCRVNEGQGSSGDALRLLRALESWSLGPARALGDEQ